MLGIHHLRDISKNAAKSLDKIADGENGLQENQHLRSLVAFLDEVHRLYEEKGFIFPIYSVAVYTALKRVDPQRKDLGSLRDLAKSIKDMATRLTNFDPAVEVKLQPAYKFTQGLSDHMSSYFNN